VLCASQPNPQTRALIKRLRRFGGLRAELPVGAARLSMRLMIAGSCDSEAVHAVTRHRISGPGSCLGVEVFEPKRRGQRSPALVWFHGGGFVLGDLTTAAPTARALVNRSGAVVVTVDYRLAPEHTLDDMYDDGLAAVAWVMRHAARLGIDPARVAVGGDSAGANIAAVVAQEHVGREPIALQVLVYGPYDELFVARHPSQQQRLDGVLDADAIAWFERRTRSAIDRRTLRHAPLRTPDLSGVPPAVIVTAGFDPSRDEGLAYYDCLRGAGITSRLLHYPDEAHGFLSFSAELENARSCLADLGAAIGDALSVPALDRPVTAGLGRRWRALRRQRQVAQTTLGITSEVIAVAARGSLGILRLIAAAPGAPPCAPVQRPAETRGERLTHGDRDQSAGTDAAGDADLRRSRKCL
jgi:acetyl esterase